MLFSNCHRMIHREDITIEKLKYVLRYKKGYLGLGNYYLENENYKNAIKYLKLAEYREENDSDIYLRLAEAYKGLKVYTFIEEQLNMAETIDPENTEVLEALANEMQRKRRYDRSIEYFKRL